MDVLIGVLACIGAVCVAASVIFAGVLVAARRADVRSDR